MKRFFLLLIAVSFAMNCSAMDAPETVEIYALSNLYQPVEFNHQLHTEVTRDCSVCHHHTTPHHTTGTGTTDIYCAKCHGQFEEIDVDSCADCYSDEPFSAESGKSTPLH